MAIRLIRDSANEDPIQPAVEAIDIAQVWRLPPAANERLLHRVVGVIGIAHDQPGDNQEALDLTRR